MARSNLVRVEHGRVPKQRQIMAKLAAKGICPFCPEGLPHCDLRNLRQHDWWTSADSGFPYEGSQAHVLFIARGHFTRPIIVAPAAWAELFKEADAQAVERKLRGWSLVVRCGDMARTAASVQHLHVHLIAGNATSAQQRRGAAEHLMFPVGYKKKPAKGR